MILDLSVLNEVQRKAVECGSGPTIVSAGAGSGKTRVLTYRVANLIINKGIPSGNILAITFTNKAAKEMRERLSKMLEEQNATICTFHALGVKILRECGEYIMPRNKYFTIYDETDKKSLIKKIVKEIDSEDKMIDTYINFISNAKSMGISPNEYCNYFGNHQISSMTERVYREYEKQLENNNAYDFDDLLCKPYELLENNLRVREYYTEKFKHILVDEFQDTNDMQFKLLKLLQSKYHNIFVVGDEDQSIYSWRGADSKNMMRFIKEFHCTQIFKLEQNYRSTEKILNTANVIISKNPDRLEKKLWTNQEGGEKVVYHGSTTEQYEADYVVRQIKNLCAYGESYKDIAVLCRMNALSRILEEKFLTYNIPYKIYGGVKFYDRVEVKNILAYLRCIVNERDNESFLRIVNFPKRKIGEVALKNLKNIDPNRSYMEILMELNKDSQLSSAQLNSFLSVKELFEELRKDASTESVTMIVSKLLKLIDIESIYDKENEEEYGRLMNIKELQSSIKEFEIQNEGAKLEDYIQSVTLMSDIDSYEDTEEAVTIATVHAVKGLEFKDVFIVGLEEGIFPLIRSDSEDNDEMEEERRLMYVAVTRAKKRLYLSNAISRFLHGKRSENFPSRYLEDLGYVKHSTIPDNQYAYDEDYGYSNRYGGGYSNYGNKYSNANTRYNDSYSSNYTISSQSNTSQTKQQSKVLSSGIIGMGNIGTSNINTFMGTSVRKNVDDKSSKVYTKGQKVKHARFGEGIVIDYDADRHIVRVAFTGLGIKLLDTDIAVLEVLSK